MPNIQPTGDTRRIGIDRACCVEPESIKPIHNHSAYALVEPDTDTPPS